MAFSRLQFLHAAGALALAPFTLNPSVAQTQTRDAGSLAPVVVTATRVESKVDESIAEVTVVPRAELERSAGRSLSQLLVQQPGIQASSNGGLGQLSSLFIRGMESRHTVLLIDGVRIGSATDGLPSLDNLSLGGFERIEVVRGPMSAIYGANAAGGVIQLFSRRAKEGFSGNASFSLGSKAFNQVTGGAAWAGEGFDGTMQISRTGYDGFSATNSRAGFYYDPDTDGFRQTSGLSRLGWQLNPAWRLEWTGMQTVAQIGEDRGNGGAHITRRENTLNALRLKGDTGSLGRSTFSLGQSRNRYRVVSSAYGAETSPYLTNQTQWGWEHQIDTRLGTAVALYERLEESVGKPAGTPDEGDPYPFNRRSVDSVGLGFDGQIEQHLWQVAVRRDSSSQFGNKATGSVGFSTPLTQTLRAGVSGGTSFLMPSFDLLYYPYPGYSNPNLRPEQGRHAEWHLAWTPVPNQKWRLAWVDSRMRDLISTGLNPMNVARSRIDGLVMSWAGQYSSLRAGLSWDHLDARNTTPGDPNEGLQLRRRARDVVRVSADAP